MAKLEAIKIAKLEPGLHCDGDNLYLRVKDSGARSWVFRFKQSGRTRELGMGSFKNLSLSDARKLATKMRLATLEGINPDTLLSRNKPTIKVFKEYAVEYIKSKRVEWKNVKHAQQWENTMETYVYPKIGNKQIIDITLSDVLRILSPIWLTKTETASRVRGRIECILDSAAVLEQIEKRNPARWKGNLDKVLAAPEKIQKVKHHPSLDYVNLPEFMRELRLKSTLTALCLRFLILTATRSNEARGARWCEIDMDSKVWEIPSERMKASREHKIPLSQEAILILEFMRRHKNPQSDLIFPSSTGRALSAEALTNFLKRTRPGISVHGFRSSFRVWGAEMTEFSETLLELCLAHAIQSETVLAYQRSDLLEKRRTIMNAWEKYCRTESKSNVIEISKPIKAA
jgi:integrase